MNVLAEKQLWMNEKGITQEEFEKRSKEFLELYYDLRTKDEGKWYSKLSLEQRKKIHWLILGIYKTINRLNGLSYETIKNESEKTDRPIIFAVTHIGKLDIQVVSEAIKEHYYLLSGDYEHIQGIPDQPFISLNGVFYFNEKVKSDRQNVSTRMINCLKTGGNLMYFIEGTWNVTENLPMLPCYWGIVDIAKAGNAIIIPIAVEQYDKHFKINVGKNFDMLNYGDGSVEKSRAIENLRDTMATLKWEIWETEKPWEREKMSGTEWDEYKTARYKEWPYFSDEYIDGLIYKPKGITPNEKAFEHVKSLKMSPNKNNAFLFNKRISGDKNN